MKRTARYVLFYSVLIAAWVILAKLKVWPPYIFPTPWGVAEALWAGFADHSFWIAIAVSMKRMLIGYGLSVVFGMILGLGIAN
ncbi:MAG: ABC transporter permease, partial [Acidobacteria bacterium]|nr:ABC transporter permease [Acidobacteriota bacterium]